MRFLLLVGVFVLVSCKPTASEVRAALASDDAGCMCPCVCPGSDAGVDAVPPDAAVDAGPLAIDLDLPWTKTSIAAGSASGAFRGADGVTIRSGCIATPWEQGNAITRACPTGATWDVKVEATGISAAEGVAMADLDSPPDGIDDIAWARDTTSVGGIGITFRGGTNVNVEIPASMGHGHAQVVDIADMTGDGLSDLVFGTRVGTPAVVGILEHPGVLARTGSAWSYRSLGVAGTAGWTMSVVPVDIGNDGRVDLVVSDRKQIDTASAAAAGLDIWAHYGSRWIERKTDGSWVSHTIAGGRVTSPATPFQTGNCSPLPYASTACQRTPGDEMFLRVVGNAVYDCTSTGSQTDSRILIHRTTDWLTWTHEVIAAVPNVGHCQGLLVYDVDGDTDDDIVVTTWIANALPVPTGEAGKDYTYWLRNDNDVYVRGKVVESAGSGGGSKGDNAEILDAPCFVTTEQIGPPAGGVGLIKYCPVSP